MTNTLEFITETIKVTTKLPCGHSVTMSYTHYTKRVMTVSSPENFPEKLLMGLLKEKEMVNG
jgi:hypothetical protein